MNYSLSSSRKIGDYIQKIITTQNNANIATSSAMLNSLKSWHSAFADLDSDDMEVGDIEYKGFTEAPSASTGNLGTNADVIFTVLTTSTSLPKTTTLKISNLTITNLATFVDAAYDRLTGSSITDSGNYLISAIVNLH